MAFSAFYCKIFINLSRAKFLKNQNGALTGPNRTKLEPYNFHFKGLSTVLNFSDPYCSPNKYFAFESFD